MFFSKHDLAPELLAKELWTISQDSYEFGAPWSLAQFQSDLANQQSEYILLLDKNELLGYLNYHWILDEAEIVNVAVKSNQQQQGYGQLLVNRLLSEAGEKGIEQIFLEVRASNSTAQKLYQKEKFYPVGVRKSYYKNPVEDGIIMCGKVRVKKCQKLQKI